MNKFLLCLMVLLPSSIQTYDLFHEITNVGTIVVISGRVYLDGPSVKLDDNLVVCHCGERPVTIELKDGNVIALCLNHAPKRVEAITKIGWDLIVRH